MTIRKISAAIIVALTALSVFFAACLVAHGQTLSVTCTTNYLNTDAISIQFSRYARPFVLTPPSGVTTITLYNGTNQTTSAFTNCLAVVQNFTVSNLPNDCVGIAVNSTNFDNWGLPVPVIGYYAPPMTEYGFWPSNWIAFSVTNPAPVTITPFEFTGMLMQEEVSNTTMISNLTIIPNYSTNIYGMGEEDASNFELVDIYWDGIWLVSYTMNLPLMGWVPLCIVTNSNPIGAVNQLILTNSWQGQSVQYSWVEITNLPPSVQVTNAPTPATVPIGPTFSVWLWQAGTFQITFQTNGVTVTNGTTTVAAPTDEIYPGPLGSTNWSAALMNTPQ